MLCRPSKVTVIPVTRSLVPIPDDVVETSDDDDDVVDHLPAVASHVSHQPRPFAVRWKLIVVVIVLVCVV